TDIGLPGGMDGHRMVLESRAARPGLPVLFMTGYAHPDVLDNSPLEPAGVVLVKPFALEALLRSVDALLKSR
ncbi:MAG TPA: hybrid sensor histidine kinase/response regulator, partial [Pseudomonas sp.]|nr:hybrid sensor histidine kinase/response regulator [Pseudomonas sp.]